MRLNKRSLVAIGACALALALLVYGAAIFLESVRQLPILMYHSINYDKDKNERTVVLPEVFAKQMKYLHDNAYDVIPLGRAVWYIDRKMRPPKKTVAITLDDGLSDNYKYAYPVLKQYNIPGTIFVITDLIGKPGYLTAEEIREMDRSGLVDIESHTKSHRWLTGLDDETLRDELTLSKKVLEKMLDRRVHFLCYPMGGYDERVKSAAAAAGYMAAFATKPRSFIPESDLYAIKRVKISPRADNLLVFRIKISGYHTFFRVLSGRYKSIPGRLWKRLCEKRSS
jgi:peptidoglycan/xylan/chitin deacetylase (PgdA/CDA1 family)